MVVDNGPAVGKAGLIALSVGESEARGNGSDPTGAVRLHELVVARANSEVPLASAHLHDGLEASGLHPQAKESVDMATIHWMNCVTTEGDTSEAVANLYAEDAVLWGTVANDVRFEPLDVETTSSTSRTFRL